MSAPRRAPPPLPTFDPEVFRERFKATMVLHGLGDSIGYKNSEFEFCRRGSEILRTVKQLGGLAAIDLENWRVSDDTIMHIATAYGLIGPDELDPDLDSVMTCIADKYVECMSEMGGRSPGGTSMSGACRLRTHVWHDVPYNSGGGGCGSSMRASCIGLRYFGADEAHREMLVAVGIESGRLTHNHPTGYLGSLAVAAFTAFALEGVPLHQWGYLFLNEILLRARGYIVRAKRDVPEFNRDKDYFVDHWIQFLNDRDINRLDNPNPRFHHKMKTDIDFREEYWDEFSYRGWQGASGDDSVIVAYDALLMGGDSYEDVLRFGCWHGGDSDSTGCIAMGLYGSMYGFRGVYDINLQNLEKRNELGYLGERLWSLRCCDGSVEIAKPPMEKKTFGRGPDMFAPPPGAEESDEDDYPYSDSRTTTEEEMDELDEQGAESDEDVEVVVDLDEGEPE